MIRNRGGPSMLDDRILFLDPSVAISALLWPALAIPIATCYAPGRQADRMGRSRHEHGIEDLTPKHVHRWFRRWNQTNLVAKIWSRSEP